MTINVSGLKSRLSHFLRRAAAGERILVLDRKEAIAEVGPVATAAVSPRERLAQQGRLRLATRKLADLRFSRVRGPVAIQDSLLAVRDES